MSPSNSKRLLGGSPSNSKKVVKVPPKRGQIKNELFKSMGHSAFKKAGHSVLFMIRLKNSMVRTKSCVSGKFIAVGIRALARRISFGHTPPASSLDLSPVPN
ncbi:hypothetical protein SUGI_0948130 [Cryptomeria japonica]|nr:hypothetical protein SUGI_0948130 [Cryptomeria japonica]